MKQEELLMHGSFFVFFNKFIENKYGSAAWLELCKTAGMPYPSYEMHENYPVSEMSSLINAAVNYTQLPADKLQEKFGEYLAPGLLTLFKSHINPGWKTFEMLENTELVMHKAVRKEETKASPPTLHVSRVSDKLLIIDYYSKRRMASIAMGIIKGIAKFYNESDKMQITLNAESNDERVQIRVEFK